MAKSNSKACLELVHKFTKKRGPNHKDSVALLPTPDPNRLCQGIFTGISVDICDASDIRRLYEGGCFGKASQSRSVPAAVYTHGHGSEQIMSELQRNETLVLNLEEACFLAYFYQSLLIKDLQGQCLEFGPFMEAAMQVQPQFVAFMAAYLHMRSKGWIVKSGTKFGGHYLMYKNGPRYYHASYLVFVAVSGDSMYLQPKNIRGLQRVAESSDKHLLTLEVSLPTVDFRPQTADDFQHISIHENIIRRLNLNLLATHNKSPINNI